MKIAIFGADLNTLEECKECLDEDIYIVENIQDLFEGGVLWLI
jgi:hypothetical protein